MDYKAASRHAMEIPVKYHGMCCHVHVCRAEEEYGLDPGASNCSALLHWVPPVEEKYCPPILKHILHIATCQHVFGSHSVCLAYVNDLVDGVVKMW